MRGVFIALSIMIVLGGCSPLPAPLLEVSTDRSGRYSSGYAGDMGGYFAEVDVKNIGNCEVEATILTTFNVEGGASHTAENAVELNQKEKTNIRAEWRPDFDSVSFALESVAVDYRINKCSDVRRFY